MGSLGASLKRASNKPKPRTVVWEGPDGVGPNGGVTQGMLSSFLVCRERFRLRVVEGLATVDTFNHYIEYGQMWHTCEEALARVTGEKIQVTHGAGWEHSLKTYVQSLCKMYPLQQEQIVHWYNVCKTQFPHYVQYWAKHPDVKDRTPLLQEQVFDVPYALPSGRNVRLRGKWDSVDLIGKGKGAGVFLQENKTKGDIDEEHLKRQLNFDLQTMIYLIALDTYKQNEVREGWQYGRSIKGIRYNVVRRPLSGGKGSIKQKQGSKNVPAETAEEFYARLANDYIAAEPSYWFMRWKVEVSQADIERFKNRFLNPCLEQLWDWWEWISTHLDDPFDGDANCIHWQTPYGIYSPLLDGGMTEVDEYLISGSQLGLQRGANLFRELQ